MRKLLLLLLLLTSCDYEYATDLVSSEFELRQLAQRTESTTKTEGYFFFIFGGYSSEESSQAFVNVFAKVDGRYKLVKMPIEQIRISIDNTIEKPTLQVEYRNTKKLPDEKLTNFSYGDWLGVVFVITCPERFLPEKLLPIQL
jgi:hypothetical protein